MHRYIVAVACIACVANFTGACKRPAQQGEQSRPLPDPGLRYDEQRVTKASSECSATSRCATFTVRYPEFVSAPNDLTKNRLNTFVRDALIQPTSGDQPASSVQERAQQFLTDYEEFRTSFPDAPVGWHVDVQANVVHEDDRVISLEIIDDSYTGGAHPNEQRTYATFDVATGDRIGLDALVAPERLDAVRQVAERQFRTTRQLQDGQSLEDAGFTFESGAFDLPPNIAVLADGLLLYYNAYEVAPYALGPTRVVLSWADLKAHLRPASPVSSMANTSR